MHLVYQVRHVCLHDFFFSSSLFLVRRLTRLACSWLAIDTLDTGRCKLDVGRWTAGPLHRWTAGPLNYWTLNVRPLDVCRWSLVVARWMLNVVTL